MKFNFQNSTLPGFEVNTRYTLDDLKNHYHLMFRTDDSINVLFNYIKNTLFSRKNYNEYTPKIPYNNGLYFNDLLDEQKDWDKLHNTLSYIVFNYFIKDDTVILLPCDIDTKKEDVLTC